MRFEESADEKNKEPDGDTLSIHCLDPAAFPALELDLVLRSSIVQGCAGGDRESCLQALCWPLTGRVDRLTGADPNLHSAGNDAANSSLIHDAQITVAQGEIHGFGSSGVKTDAPKSSERANRSAIDAGMRKIKLHHFIPGEGTGVGHPHGDGEIGRASCRERVEMSVIARP